MGNSVEEMIAAAVAEARAEAYLEGQTAGRAEGRLKERMEIAFKLLQAHLLTEERLSDFFEFTPDQAERVVQLYQRFSADN